MVFVADGRHWFVPCGEQERRDIKLKEGMSRAGLGILKTAREIGVGTSVVRVEMMS